MQKINFQLQTNAVLNSLAAQNKRESLLLHACCAPCASYVLEYLTHYFNITVFFSNSNITNANEYQKRLQALYRLCSLAPFCKGVAVVADDYNPQSFFAAAKGLEKEPEGGVRCTACFKLRLGRAAQYAAENGFSYFATSLSISPYKNAALLNSIGEGLAKKYGSLWLPADFKKRGGYQRSIELCRQYGIYRQHYCGCAFSQPANRTSDEQEK